MNKRDQDKIHGNTGKTPWNKGKTKYDCPGMAIVSMKKIGRTKNNHIGTAIAAAKLKGRTKENNEAVARIAQKRIGQKSWCKGLTKENNMSVVIRSWKNVGRVSRYKGLSKKDVPYLETVSRKLTGRTKYDTPYLAETSKKLKGRTKETHPGIAAMAEKLRGRNKWNNSGIRSAIEKRKLYTGERSPRWLGGKSFEPYTKHFNKHLKNKIRTRDNNACQKCGTKQEYLIRCLSVHHIDYNKYNLNESNLITLCIHCHPSVNSNRDFWQRFFIDKIHMMEINEYYIIYG